MLPSLDISTLFNQSWALYRRHMVPFTTLAAAITLPTLGLNLLAQPSGPDDVRGMILSWSAIVWQLSAILILAGPLASSCVSALDGEQHSAELYARTARKPMLLIKTAALISIGLYLPFLLGVPPTLITLVVAEEMIPFYLAAPLLTLPFLFVAAPAAYAQERSAHVLKRSAALSRGARAQLFSYGIGITFTIYLIDASALILQLLISAADIKHTAAWMVVDKLPALLVYVLASISCGFWATFCATTYHALIMEEQRASSPAPI